jgi:hypothetical protein
MMRKFWTGQNRTDLRLGGMHLEKLGALENFNGFHFHNLRRDTERMENLANQGAPHVQVWNPLAMVARIHENSLAQSIGPIIMTREMLQEGIDKALCFINSSSII